MDRRQLPDGWEFKKLVDVTDLITCGVAKRPEYVDNGIPFLSAKNVKNGQVIWDNYKYISDETHAELTKNNKPKKGDILYTRVGSFGEAAIIDKDIEFSVFVSLTLIKTKEQILNSFLKYYLNSHSVKILAKNSISGSGVGNLNVGTVRNFLIPVPSLDEQKRIVAILDEAFEGIDQAIRNTEKNLANARELFDSYLNFKLLPIASGHTIQTLACITDLIVDCEHKTAPTQEIGIPSIRTPNIGKGYLIFDNVNRVSEETYELWTKRAKPISGDLILAREAPAGNIGIIPEGERVCLGQRTVLIRPKKNRIDSQFLAFLLLHPFIQKRLLAKSTGATVQHVNMKDIRELKLSELPSIQTQQKLTKELKDLRSQGDRLETIYRKKLAALNELKQSILQKAFTGQLTK